MNNSEKYIELISDEITDEKLIAFYKREYENAETIELGEFKNLIEKLGYRASYTKIINAEGQEVTIKDFLNDLQNKAKQDDKFKMRINTCRHLQKYIDFEKTKIDVLLPINIDNENQEFLKKLHNCNKLIYIDSLSLLETRKIDWIKQENTEFTELGVLEEKLDITPEELVEKYKMFREYAKENNLNEYTIEGAYKYFITGSYNIESPVGNFSFDELFEIDRWMEDNGYKKDKVNIQIGINNKEIINEKAIKRLLESDKHTVQGLVKGEYITKEEIENIEELERIGLGIKVKKENLCLKVDTISEINNDIIEKLGITSILIGANENHNEEEISVEKYKKIRSILDEVVKNIDPEQSDREKFKTVYTILANMLTYDDEATEKGTEYADENKEKCRNLENGLLLGKCVCAGYAEILKQTLSLVGIESHFVGSQADKEEITHAYNIVKIDGKWYNTDLTWDYENIRNNIPPQYCLKNDEDFRKVGKLDSKEHHIPRDEQTPECEDESIELYPELKKNVFYKKANFLIRMARETGFKRIMKNIGGMIADKFKKKEALLPAGTEQAEQTAHTKDAAAQYREEMKIDGFVQTPVTLVEPVNDEPLKEQSTR